MPCRDFLHHTCVEPGITNSLSSSVVVGGKEPCETLRNSVKTDVHPRAQLQTLTYSITTIETTATVQKILATHPSPMWLHCAHTQPKAQPSITCSGILRTPSSVRIVIFGRCGVGRESKSIQNATGDQFYQCTGSFHCTW